MIAAAPKVQGVAAICTKCRQHYAAAANEPLLPVHVCPRCFAVDQLLKTADEVHAQIKRALDEHQSLGARTVARSALVRLQADVARVRRTA